MDLTISEAYLEMYKDNFVSHITFSKGEYLYIDSDGTIRDEKGYTTTDWWEEANKNDKLKKGWYVVRD